MVHNENIWTTKTGEKIKIKDIADNHLLNIIKMLYRKFEEYIEHTPEIYFIVLKEAQNRGLKIDNKVIITLEDVEDAYEAKCLNILSKIEAEERQWGSD